MVGMMVNNAITSVWLFEAAREYEHDPARAQVALGRLMSRLATLMAVIWLVVAAAGGDMVRWLTNERFHAAAGYVPGTAPTTCLVRSCFLSVKTRISPRLSWGSSLRSTWSLKRFSSSAKRRPSCSTK